MNERIASATVHGRYLVIPPARPDPAPILVGFHGYAEDAEIQLERLRAIPGSDQWLRVSIQALHPFYVRRTNQVVASWMTTQQRELAIQDNLAWTATCLDAVASEWPTLPTTVFSGFSQGVAMAYRAAVNAARTAVSVMAVGGDIPPEIETGSLHHVSATLIVRGTTDTWYTREKFEDDKRRLQASSVRVDALEFDGGHEWSLEASAAAAQFLRQRLR